MLARRQPDKPAAASNKLCSIRTLNGVYTEFGIDPLPARRGFVERGRQKIASLFLAGTEFYLLRVSAFAARFAARSAAQKGAPPPFIPCKLFEKSLTKNFTVLAG